MKSYILNIMAYLPEQKLSIRK